MHFNPNPACPSVISKSTKSTVKGAHEQTITSSHDNSSRRPSVPKHISYDLMIPFESGFVKLPLSDITYSISLPEKYDYLFYEEINPPPPKSC